jgi:hypothetical protein
LLKVRLPDVADEVTHIHGGASKGTSIPLSLRRYVASQLLDEAARIEQADGELKDVQSALDSHAGASAPLTPEQEIKLGQATRDRDVLTAKAEKEAIKGGLVAFLIGFLFVLESAASGYFLRSIFAFMPGLAGLVLLAFTAVLVSLVEYYAVREAGWIPKMRRARKES